MALSKEQALEFCSRFEAINEVEKAELRAMSPEEGFRQVALLMQAATDFGWTSRMADEDQVRKTWIRLKEHV